GNPDVDFLFTCFRFEHQRKRPGRRAMRAPPDLFYQNIKEKHRGALKACFNEAIHFYSGTHPVTGKRLSGNGLRFAVALMHYHWTDSGVFAEPGRDGVRETTLAKLIGVHPSTVKRTLTEVQEHGLFVSKRGRGERTNAYYPNWSLAIAH